MIDKENIKTYACMNKNINVRKNCSSGGVFYELAKYIIDNEGIVFATKFDEDFNIIFDYFTNEKDINQFTGSKYAPSKLKNTFKIIEEYLREGRLVMFCGTPCQNNGLSNFLNLKYDNLIQVDFICHGVPDGRVWEKYLKTLKERGNIKNIQFRNKEKGWKNFQFRVDYENGDFFCENHNNNIYMRGFLANLYLKSSCYNCKNKGYRRTSDITMADLWGADSILPKLNDDQGISAVFINTEKGMNIFNNINDRFIYEKINMSTITKYNIAYYESVQKHRNNERFMKNLEDTSDVVKLIERNLQEKELNKIIKKIKYTIKKKIYK